MYDGMINIYKEKGFTSHDVVAKLRGILGQKKIGHTGTLDPDATGVLPVCLGSATKLSDMITAQEKTYKTLMHLGITTDTQDISGKVLEEKKVESTLQEIRDAIMSFVGSYDQIPPMYSAIKIGGRKLYDIARSGQTVEREPRRVEIISIEITSENLPLIGMTVRCSKGTYIRTLCHDIGRKLGCGACMQELLRTQTGIFTDQDALKLSQLEDLKKSGRINEHIIPVEQVLCDYPKAFSAGPDIDIALYNGNGIKEKGLKLDKNKPLDGLKVRTYDSRGRFIAVYQYIGSGHYFKNYKMFYTGQ